MTKPITTMSDREKLDFVAKGYNELMVLEANRRRLMAEMIRGCLQRITAPVMPFEGINERRKRVTEREQALDYLAELATRLEAESVRSPDTKSTEG